MTFHWPYLAVAALLLWLPLPLNPSVRRYIADPERARPPEFLRLLGAWQNWVDFLRASAAVCLLLYLALDVDKTVKGATLQALALRAGFVGLGVLVQSLRFNEGNIGVLAPVFYLSGITLTLGGWEAGTFAVCVAWLFAIIGKDPRLILPIMGVALGAATYILSGINLLAFANVALIFLPNLLGIVVFRKVLFLMRSRGTLRTADQSALRPQPPAPGPK